MKNLKNKKPFLKTSSISVGLATFLVVGLGGCDHKEDDHCNDPEYKKNFPTECHNKEVNNRLYGSSNGSTNSNNQNHSTSTSWIPLWLMMNSGSNNAHSGYSYSSNSGTKSSSYFSPGGSHSTGSSSSGG